MEIARQKAVPFKGHVPSQFWCGEMFDNQPKGFIIMLFIFACGIPDVARPTAVGLNSVCLARFSMCIIHDLKADVGGGNDVFIWRKSFAFCPSPSEAWCLCCLSVMKSCQVRCSHLTPPNHPTPVHLTHPSPQPSLLIRKHRNKNPGSVGHKHGPRIGPVF